MVCHRSSNWLVHDFGTRNASNLFPTFKLEGMMIPRDTTWGSPQDIEKYGGSTKEDLGVEQLCCLGHGQRPANHIF